MVGLARKMTLKKALQYPFLTKTILRKRKEIKKELIGSRRDFIEKRIAILGGANTHDIREILDLFLLNEGVKAQFYESGYEQYWKEVMSEKQELRSFKPDIIYVCTSRVNIESFPESKDSTLKVKRRIREEFGRYQVLWKKIKKTYKCPIIQNNFEWPEYRIWGNQEAVRENGKISFINELNRLFYDFARKNGDFYINDICYLSARIGIDKWRAGSEWYLYRNAQSLEAVPILAQSVALIIKSILGKNKKVMAIDLDNTIWGGIIGEEGVERIKIGHEGALDQAYTDFQKYLKSLKETGILLVINSKNELRTALKGLKNPENSLKKKDFVLIKANWKNKTENIEEICRELNVLPESLVVIDDDKRERELISTQMPEVAIPPLRGIENYIELIDRSGFFEKTTFLKEDQRKTEQYLREEKRKRWQGRFDKYQNYLESLKMKAEIRTFRSVYLPRITQLMNKCNQFNLTGRKVTESELKDLMKDKNYLCLYCKLEDKFGKNGLVSALIGKIEGRKLRIENWLMSCRVFGRDLEKAILDETIKISKERGVKIILGYYQATGKNMPVSNLYSRLGFKKKNKFWKLEIKNYKKLNKTIEIKP